MARYDYACPCGRVQEVEHPMREAGGDREFDCTRCRRTTVHRRVYAPTAIQFKGTGFSTTDKRDEIERWQFAHLSKD